MFQVSNSLGIGFIESVYHEALIVELARRNHSVQSKAELTVKYEGATVGKFNPDLIVDKKIIVEVKAVENLIKPHFAQALNYLRITDLDAVLVVNFGTSQIQYRRFDNRFRETGNISIGNLLKPSVKG